MRFSVITLSTVPEDVKDQLRNSPIGKNLNLESKLSLRERQQAQKAAQEQTENEFTEASGIKNPRSPWDEHLERTRFELLRIRKRQEKMNMKDL